MMINRILATCVVVTAGAAAMSHVQAQQAYPPPPGSVYPSGRVPYDSSVYPPSSGGYSADYRRNAAGAPQDFDALDDQDPDEAAAVVPPPGPGPILSPDDPRYARGVPSAYSAAPTGPVMSPDDPRYGRPASPSVIYADRPGGAPQPYASGDPAVSRPPGGMNAAAGVTGSVPPAGADGRPPMTVAALPPEEQPDAAPAQLSPNLRRQEVPFVTKEPAGTIVVDTPNTYLYYVLGGGRAIRYGVRVGREGFTWTGVQKITKKTEWPDWFPPTEMIERQPYLPRFMAGGPGNPLGARAMYLGSTVYRIHGTNQPSTIGKFVSSGCIGMLNDDVSDLFDRVKVGTRVVVMPGGPSPGVTTASAAPMPPAPAAGPSGPAPAQMQMAAPPAQGVPPPLPAPVTIR
ncbi:L,D-transpeptidase [Bradyrhizobium sp.]|uniref:L,D-transpeptidase n=1 Tax=Bradyrhizobium sp. TaxID=376 RepID=UPI0025BFCDD5|nr:L,D-transpeptidase [Bradyrhizobium sp.]